MPFDGTGYVQSYALDKMDRVIDLLSTEERWCKGIAETPGGRHCIIGAIRAVQAQLVLEPVILQAIKEVTGRSYWRIESFNDAKVTSHALVLQVLQRARANVAAGQVATVPADTGVRSWWRPVAKWWAGLAA